MWQECRGKPVHDRQHNKFQEFANQSIGPTSRIEREHARLKFLYAYAVLRAGQPGGECLPTLSNLASSSSSSSFGSPKMVDVGVGADRAQGRDGALQ